MISPALSEGVDKLKQTVFSGPRSNMPYRVLKAVVDLMGKRYRARDYKPLGLEGILSGLGLTELRTDTRDWLTQVSVCVCGGRGRGGRGGDLCIISLSCCGAGSEE